MTRVRCREMDLPPYSLLNGSSSSNLLGGGGDMAGNMATQWEPQQQEGGGMGLQVTHFPSRVCQRDGFAICTGQVELCYCFIQLDDRLPAVSNLHVGATSASLIVLMYNSHVQAW